MIRRTLKLAAATLIAAVAFASFAEAAPPQKRIRHRVKHARGASYRTATPGPVAKKKKATVKKKRPVTHSPATTSAHRPAQRRSPSTKPR